MANLQISEELDTVLESAAVRSGRSKDELAHEILSAHLEDESLPLSAFTPEQLKRLESSFDHAKRSDLLLEPEIDRFFQTWFQEIEAR